MTLINNNNHAKFFGTHTTGDLETAPRPREHASEDRGEGYMDARLPYDAQDQEVGASEGDTVSFDRGDSDAAGSFAGLGVRATGGGDVVGFETYVVPIQSTDYKGLEAIDPRLADREWRLDNLYTVINEQGELVKFRLRPAQRKEHYLESASARIHHIHLYLLARLCSFQ